MKLRVKSEKYTIIFEGKVEEFNSIKESFSAKKGTSNMLTDNKNANSNSSNEKDVPNVGYKAESAKRYELWKTDVECPFCGAAYIAKERSTNTFTKCKRCHEALYLKWATEERGVANEKGFLFIANEPMKFKSDNISEDIPTSDSSLEEIYKWLDEKGVDYSRNSSKEKLLELIMKIEVEKTF